MGLLDITDYANKLARGLLGMGEKKDKSVMDNYTPPQRYIGPWVNPEPPLGPPTIGPVSLDPTDYLGPKTLANAAAMGKALLMSGAKGMAAAPMMAGMFHGVDSPAADMDALKQARRMLVSGATPEEAWKATGWGLDPAKQWTFETSDHLASINPTHPMAYLSAINPMGKAKTAAEAEMMGRNYNAMLDAVRNNRAADGKLPTLLDHDALYAAHPDAKGYRVEFKNLGVPFGASWGNGRIDMGMGFLGQGDDGMRALLHEVNHSIQDKQGRSRGTSPEEVSKLFNIPDPKQAMAAYNKVYGEAESRQVANRWKMTPEERLNSYPWNPDTFKSQTADHFGRNGVYPSDLLFVNP